MIELDHRVIYLDMPATVKAYTVLDGDGFYTIALNKNLSYEQNMKSYRHEMLHIRRHDFENDMSIDDIERTSHED